MFTGQRTRRAELVGEKKEKKNKKLKEKKEEKKKKMI